MTTMKPTKTSKGGCGCGCGGGKSSPCNCSHATCDACSTPGLVRPRFFAGQLLTEDDLDLLSQYTVEKNRLHNRYLWGDGVVCGLEVTEHPCGGGKVIVQPGYALDCCGNDILVQFETTLDINAMVRQLRIDMLGGYDCGDPCADKEPEPPPPQDVPGRTPGVGSVPTTHIPSANPPPTEPAPPPSRAKTYCLYAVYCEQQTDPIAAYATGESCNQACEASREREGYRFELRCPPKCDHEPTIIDRLCDCLGDLVRKEKAAADVNVLERMEKQYSAALTTFGQPPAPSVEAMKTSIQDLQTMAKETDLTKIDAAKASEAVRIASANLAQFYSLGEDKRPEELSALVESGQAALANVSEKLKTIAADEKLALPELEREYVKVAAETAGKLSRPLTKADIAKQETKLLAAGVLTSGDFEAKLTASLAQVAETIPRRPEIDLTATIAPRPTFFEMAKPVVMRRAETEIKTVAGVNSIRKRYEEIRKVREERAAAYRECVCSALLPPCPVCEDTAVLIACLSIEACEIVDICNLVRKFVLTPVNLRYWVPWIGVVEQFLRQQCCPTDPCSKKSDAGPATDWPRRSQMTSVATQIGRAYTGLLRAQCLEPKSQGRAGYQFTAMHLLSSFAPEANVEARAPEPAFSRNINNLEARIAELEERVRRKK